MQCPYYLKENIWEIALKDNRLWKTDPKQHLEKNVGTIIGLIANLRCSYPV